MGSSSRDVLARLDRALPPAALARIESLGSAPPARPEPAASVVLLRDHRGRLETYALHRHSRMPFAAGMVVFPGGRVDAADGVPAADHDLGDPTLLACAVRETAEETGVRLQSSGLLPWAHWITPGYEPRRYDTFFYLAELPDGQLAADISGETSAAEWQTPTDLLSAVDSGDIGMLAPTISILLELAAFDSVRAALAAATGRRIETVLPRAIKGPDGWSVAYAPVEITDPQQEG